jgi:hypothetical protein
LPHSSWVCQVAMPKQRGGSELLRRNRPNQQRRRRHRTRIPGLHQTGRMDQIRVAIPQVRERPGTTTLARPTRGRMEPEPAEQLALQGPGRAIPVRMPAATQPARTRPHSRRRDKMSPARVSAVPPEVRSSTQTIRPTIGQRKSSARQSRSRILALRLMRQRPVPTLAPGVFCVVRILPYWARQATTEPLFARPTP